MNRDRAAKLWPMIKAFAEGKTVQFLNSGKEWVDLHYLALVDNFEYRLKPEPKEFWVNEYPDGLREYCKTKASADRFAEPGRLSCKHFIEIMED